MSFLSGPFLWAAIAATGPILIHLLSRQRQTTIDWAAMDFLLRAVKRRRRRLQLRDLLLLLHAIIAVDNSLSMAHTTMDQTLLDRAKDRVATFLRSLPSGSDISLIPTCSQSDLRTSGVYDSPQDAIDSLQRFSIVDRKARMGVVLSDLKKLSTQQGTEPAKRFFIVSDMQATSWNDTATNAQLPALGDLQVIEVGGEQKRDNSWIDSFTLRDGYAEVGRPVTFEATLRHEGTATRTNIRVTLTVGEDTVGEQLVDLKPGDKKRVSFEYAFPLPGGVVDPALLPVRVEMEPDALSADDSRMMIAPLFRRGPVLFIDQYGAAESFDFNRLGETLPLRMLYQDAASAVGGSSRDAAPRHTTLSELRQEDLNLARVVVLGGIDAPSPSAVALLRSYVERGGQLLIAPGGDFNPALWSTAVIDQTDGILPTPLQGDMIGQRPRSATQQPNVFRLDGTSLDRDIFDMNLSDTQWEDLVSAPFFYQAVRLANPADDSIQTDNTSRVVGRYQGGEPFVVHRRLGNGNILFLTTSIFPSWNNVAVNPDGAILLYDQMVRWLLRQSLEQHTLAEQTEHIVPVNRLTQDHRFDLLLPGYKTAMPLAVEAVGSDDFALIVRNLDRRGIYTIRHLGPDDSAASERSQVFYTFAACGPSEESNLAAVNKDSLTGIASSDSAAPSSVSPTESLIWVEANVPISLLGGSMIGYDLWLYLLIAALVCLVAEMVVAAGPATRKSSEEVSP